MKFRVPAAGLLLFVAPMITASGQIIYEASDLPVIGDALVRHTDTVPGFGPGPGGPGIFWDFSTAVPLLTTTTEVMLPAATPDAATFTGSNVAMSDDQVNYLYFAQSPNSLIATGVAGDLLGNGGALSVPFSSTLLVHDLPRTYGSHFNDQYAFEVTADGAAFGVNSIRLHHRGDVFDTTDAYGLITTPIGTYACLRVKTTEYSVDSLWFRLFPFGSYTFLQEIIDTSITYSWLTKETKLAVAEMTTDSLGNAQRFVYSALPPSISTGVRERADTGVRIHPQPATNGFTLEMDRSERFRSVEIRSIDGRTMHARAVTADRVHVATDPWPRGVYLVVLTPWEQGLPIVRRVVLQ